MTTAMSGGEWAGKPPWYRRVLMWLGHYVLRVALVLALIGLAVELVAQLTHGPASTWLDTLATWIGVVMMLAYLASDAHEDMVCDYCLHGRVMETGTEAAERNDRWLRYYHRVHGGSVWKNLILVVFFTGTVFIANWVPSSFAPVARWLAFAAWIAWLGWSSSLTTIHRWNRLYCKYCKKRPPRGDDGPAPDWTPPPDPTEQRKTPTPTVVRLR